MDKNSKELQEALYELCQAVMKVMRLAYTGSIPAELASATVRTTLQHLVNITGDVSSLDMEDASVQTHSGQSTVMNAQTISVPEPVQDVPIEVKYAYSPSSIPTGGFVFKRLTTSPKGQRYKITKYPDYVEFEPIEITGEELESAWQAKKDNYPDGVINAKGAPTVGTTIYCIEKGRGIMVGPNVEIKSSCTIGFRSGSTEAED